jgi:hypothetical protein
MLDKTDKIMLITLTSIFTFFLTAYTAYFSPREVAYYEASNAKEFIGAHKSNGDCRIVNTLIALENDYELYSLDKHNTTTSQRHIVAVDNNGIVYDVSKGTNAVKGEKLEDYLKKNDFYVYLIVKPSSFEWRYKGGVDTNIAYASSYLYYLHFFKQAYTEIVS